MMQLPQAKDGPTINADLEQARQAFVVGVEHFEAGRLPQARQCFEASLALAPGRASVLLNLGITHFRLGQWNEAIDWLQRAANADPAKPDAHAFLGLAQEATAQWPAAVMNPLGR